MKILRNEHQEVMNQLFTLERRNSSLTAENEALKRMILAGDAQKYGKLEKELTTASNNTQQSPGKKQYVPPHQHNNAYDSREDKSSFLLNVGSTNKKEENPRGPSAIGHVDQSSMIDDSQFMLRD